MGTFQNIITLVFILAFFVFNSFFIGSISKRYMNTINISSRFVIGSMALWTLLLIFEAIGALFGVNYNSLISNNQLSIGFIFFLIIQISLLVFYAVNWNILKINFNINWWQICSFLIIFIFLISLYYGFVLEKNLGMQLIKGSAFFEIINMLFSFSNPLSLGEDPLLDQYLLEHGINIFLLIVTASSINSLTKFNVKNIYIILKKIALAIFFIAMFFTLSDIEDKINFLFVIPYLIMLFGFYWNDSDILVNDNDKNNVLILTITAIITFNYWFVSISLFLAMLFLIFAFKRATTIAIFDFSRIFNIALFAIAMSLTNFRFPVNDNPMFILKIFISAGFLGLFMIFLLIYNFLKKNQTYRNIVFKTGEIFSKSFYYIFISFLAFEYFVLVFVFFVFQALPLNSINPEADFLQAFFSFFQIDSNNLATFGLFFALWIALIIIFIVSFSIRKMTEKKIKVNIILKRLNLTNFEGNIIFVSFIAIAFIFNPLFFPVIAALLNSNILIGNFYELTNIGTKYSFLNLIWVIPFLVTLSKLNERGINIIKNPIYLIASEFLFTMIILTYPIYELARR